MRMIVSSMVGISLLIQCCWSVPRWTETEKEGCQEWWPVVGRTDVRCKRCHPGNRILKRIGPSPEDLCTPCEEGTYTVDPTQMSCSRCKQCGGMLVHVEACTRTKDTVCGCPKGFRCRDSGCASCVKECQRGQEPKGISCRDCPSGTFNDQIHQMCKPCRTTCPHPDEYIVKGDRFSDSKCSSKAMTTTPKMTITPKMTTTKMTMKTEDTMLPWWLVIAASCVVLLIPLILMIKIIKKQKEKKTKLKEPAKQNAKKPPFITTPTDHTSNSFKTLATPDEPLTLIAIECSFHEPEQVSSSESLATETSEGSTQKLIA